MSLTVVLCPWVVTTENSRRGRSPEDLHSINFEFESSATADGVKVAEDMKRCLELASIPLATYGFSVQLPERSDPRISNLWDRLGGQQMQNPPSQLQNEQSPDLILTMLTRRSISTLIESTTLAALRSAPQVCVGIDMPVPSLLDTFGWVSSVELSADESLFLPVMDTACRQNA
jgi:hypothetical protein